MKSYGFRKMSPYRSDMKRRTLLTLLLAPIVSPLLVAWGRVYPVETEPTPGITLEDIRMVREKMQKLRIPTFQGQYWFDIGRGKFMGTEDYKDLIKNENLRIQKINNVSKDN